LYTITHLLTTASLRICASVPLWSALSPYQIPCGSSFAEELRPPHLIQESVQLINDTFTTGG
jgi:hypothetical protein